MRTLESTSGGESPARATISLILDRCNGTFLDPIDSIFIDDRLVEPLSLSLINNLIIVDVSKDGLELFGRPVRELIVAGDPALARSVVLFDEVVDDSEVSNTFNQFLNISDLSAILGHVAKIIESSHLN